MFNNSKENKDIIFEYINSYDKNVLRKMRGEEINNLTVFTSLYIDEDVSKEIRNEVMEWSINLIKKFFPEDDCVKDLIDINVLEKKYEVF